MIESVAMLTLDTAIPAKVMELIPLPPHSRLIPSITTSVPFCPLLGDTVSMDTCKYVKVISCDEESYTESS